MSITANEFRLSNLITFEDITVKFEELIQDSISSDTELDERIQPIRLTKDWLLNFGFECDNDNQFAINMEGYNWTIRIHDGLMGFDYHEYHPIRKILYVHELQNLYYAITGTELIVKN